MLIFNTIKPQEFRLLNEKWIIKKPCWICSTKCWLEPTSQGYPWFTIVGQYCVNSWIKNYINSVSNEILMRPLHINIYLYSSEVMYSVFSKIVVENTPPVSPGGFLCLILINLATGLLKRKFQRQRIYPTTWRCISWSFVILTAFIILTTLFHQIH